MKTIFGFLFLVLFITPCFAQQDLLPAYKDEVRGNGFAGNLAYFIADGKPFTGALFEKANKIKLGEFKEGYRNGLFTEYYDNGKKKSETNYLMGIKDGTQKEWFENGNTQSEVGYLKGSFYGNFKEWYSNGQEKQSFIFTDGKIIDGKYSTYLEDGNKETEMTIENGDTIYYGKYINGQIVVYLESSNEMYPNGQKKSQGFIRNEKKEGKWIYWYENSQKKSEGYYKNGKEEGKWLSWYENGDKEFDGNYSNGQKEGYGEFYTDKGSIFKCEWKNGKKNGKGTLYESGIKGNASYDGYFVDDKYEGQGTLKVNLTDLKYTYTGEYKDGNLNGKGTFHQDLGNGNYKTYEGYFVNGKFEGQGVQKVIYANGEPPAVWTGEFKNGELYNGYSTSTNATQYVTRYHRNGEITSMDVKEK